MPPARRGEQLSVAPTVEAFRPLRMASGGVAQSVQKIFTAPALRRRLSAGQRPDS